MLGLDIGITSVGWAVLNLDGKRIEDLGVRAFNAAENPKNQDSLAKPRRLARGARRRLRRRARRLLLAKELFVRSGLIDQSQVETAFQAADGKASPWELRVKGLDDKLSGEEFARALFHIIKFRGFKSNRKKAKASNKEDEKMLGSIEANKHLLEEKYRTVGEMFVCDPKFQERKHNSTESYEHTVEREMLEQEIVRLFEQQRSLGNPLATCDLEQEFLEIFKWQKPFASGDDIIKLIGTCTFEKDQIRAAKHSYSAERFILLQKINSLTYLLNGNTFFLEGEQRKKIEELAYKNTKLTYEQVRKALSLHEEAHFTGVNYMQKKGKEKDSGLKEPGECEKSAFIELKGYHTLRKVCQEAGVWEQVKGNTGMMDDILTALTFYKTDEDIVGNLQEAGTSQDVIEAVLQCDGGFTKAIHLSLCAVNKILPFLEKGLLYSDACAAAGYDHTNPGQGKREAKLVPIPDELTNNPVVHRALTQARKVVNAVITRYGSPYSIHIELAREVGKSAEKRKEIKNRQDENEAQRKRREEQFAELFPGQRPNSTDLLKLRLYHEQGGRCAYSLKTIELARLPESGYLQIDHILPESRSHEDSLSNKVLALTSENQHKRNQTPCEYFGGDQARWEEFEDWVKATIKDPKKRNNLLRKKFDPQQEREWKSRNLNDTSYIARAFSSFLRDNLLFADPTNKLPVVCLNGFIVSKARWLWGIPKEREENDLHHAADAAVVAALMPHQVELLTRYAQVLETGEPYIDKETGETIEWEQTKRPRFPQPWRGFRKEVMARLSDDPAQAIQQIGLDSYSEEDKLRPVVVSRMPQRKVSGEIHEATIRSAKRLGSDKISAIRKPLTSLKKGDLDNLFAPETNEKLYCEIKRRMAQYDNDGKKAFVEPLRKPTNDGTPGSIVKSVKICQKQLSGVEVRGGIADNGDMIRTDVFRKDGKYYLVPVYVSDRMAKRLPNRAISAHKNYEEWTIVDDSYEFLYSLYPYDLIYVETKKEQCFGYYRECDRSTATITISSPNKNDANERPGTKTAIKIQKYEMGILGDYHPVRREVRRGLENGRHLKPGAAES